LGCFTAITGVIFAICQKDIKHILAYHTISQVGLIVVGISSEPIVGFYGGMAHLFNHFLFKGLLFLGAGIIINEYGVRKIPDIKGLGKSHPFLTLFMFIGILSISGAPFFNGYVSKNMLKLGVAGNYGQWILPIVNFGTILSFVKFSTIFFGKPITKTKLKKNQVFALGIMAVLCLASAIVELRLFSLSEVLPYKYAKLFTLSSASHYVVSVCIAVLAYKFIISKDVKPMKKIRRFYVSFPNANMFLLGFLILVLFYLNRATIVPIF